MRTFAQWSFFSFFPPCVSWHSNWLVSWRCDSRWSRRHENKSTLNILCFEERRNCSFYCRNTKVDVLLPDYKTGLEEESVDKVKSVISFWTIVFYVNVVFLVQNYDADKLKLLKTYHSLFVFWWTNGKRF